MKTLVRTETVDSGNAKQVIHFYSDGTKEVFSYVNGQYVKGGR